MVAAPERTGAPHSSPAHLAAERHTAAQPSATAPRRARVARGAIGRGFCQFVRPGELAPMREFFLGREHPYWNFHYTLTSAASAAENGA